MGDNKQGVKKSMAGAAEPMNLKLVGADGGVFQIEMNKHPALKELKVTHSKNPDVTSVIFRFGGAGEEGRKEGHTNSLTAVSEEVTTPVEVVNEYINLKVVGCDGSLFHYMVKKHKALRGLMSSYSKRVGLDVTRLRFRFNGECVMNTTTPSEMGMVDGDEIEVFRQLVG